jgi:hypothetical protein
MRHQQWLLASRYCDASVGSASVIKNFFERNALQKVLSGTTLAAMLLGSS